MGAGLAVAVTWLLALVPLVLWLVVSRRDHYFRDELYFAIAGRRPDLGYVDFPMMTATLASLSQELFGESLVGLRLFPALAGSATIALTARLAREMGGGPLAQLLAALATLVAPVFLTNALFGPDALDRTLWVAGWVVLARMLDRDEPRLWLAFGVIAALGLLTKMTMLFFGFAVVVGLLAGGHWRLLVSLWALGGGAIALAGLSPYLLWQFRRGWPTLEFWAGWGKLADLSWREFAPV
jgi:4-amino-4-deoxy-L-arabinose transferase-like glycosyltransferase